MRAFTGALMKGSSPLTRGKPERRGRWQCRDGLIPAHAGKTSVTVTATVTAWAHPRSRGENSGTASRPRSTTGSSPLTRGKLQTAWEGIKTGGLIPAHAGKTRTSWAAWSPPRAHPRSRGENIESEIMPEPGRGSSPLTRGKRVEGRPPGHCRRLIPAHAGKTAGGRSRGGCSRAHPRSRGENITNKLKQLPGWGSSPLTRGKPHLEPARRDRRGLIPAHAGKTAHRRRIHHDRRAHPRSRGENSVG